MWNDEFLLDIEEENTFINQSRYYDSDYLYNLMENRNLKNTLSVINLNCRSLVKNYSDLAFVAKCPIVSLPGCFTAKVATKTALITQPPPTPHHGHVPLKRLRSSSVRLTC